MLKIRITYNRENEEELKKATETIQREFNILNTSRVYQGRGESKYNNIYLDVENKKRE